jgi:hypothetical protein
LSTHRQTFSFQLSASTLLRHISPDFIFQYFSNSLACPQENASRTLFRGFESCPRLLARNDPISPTSPFILDVPDYLLLHQLFIASIRQSSSIFQSEPSQQIEIPATKTLTTVYLPIISTLYDTAYFANRCDRHALLEISNIINTEVNLCSAHRSLPFIEGPSFQVIL